MKAIVLLGAPGAGKGTAAEGIKAATTYIHVSTGDMLRAAVKKGTPLGVEAEGYMKRGELVPDNLIVSLVEERLKQGKSDDAYMFDGFPRTEEQADLLDIALRKCNAKLNKVFSLDAPRDMLIKRLTGRRVCRKCSTNFHIINIPPKKPGICDACGGDLYQRTDDQESAIVNRLEVYRKQTEGLIARYERQGILVRVDSARHRDELIKEILQHIGKI